MPSKTDQVVEALAGASEALIIGYGNPLRGDDASGPLAARGLRLRGFNAVEIHQLTPELAESLSRAGRAIFIDADASLPPGEISVTRIAPAGPAIDHHASPAALLRLTRQVYGRAPDSILIRIGAESFEFGRPLSRAVRRAVEVIVRSPSAFPQRAMPQN